MKKFVVIALAATTALSMTGCSKMTPDKLVSEMSENMAKEDSYDMDADFELSMAVDLGSVFGEEGNSESSGSTKMSFDISGDIDMITNKKDDKNAKTHIDGNLSVGLFGMESESPVLGYIEQEDGKTVSYMLNNESGKWEKSTEELISADELMKFFDENKEKLTVKEETEEINGQDCYVLTGSFTKEEVKAMLDESDVSAEDMDMSDMEFPGIEATMYVGKKTMLPVQVSISSSAEDENGDVSLQATIEFGSWGNAKEVVIPEAARKATEKDGEILFEGSSLGN